METLSNKVMNTMIQFVIIIIIIIITIIKSYSPLKQLKTVHPSPDRPS